MTAFSRSKRSCQFALTAAVNLILTSAAFGQALPTSGVLIDPLATTPVTIDGAATAPTGSVLVSQINSGGLANALITSTGAAPFSTSPVADVLGLAANPTDSATVSGSSVTALAALNQQGALVDAAVGGASGAGLGYANFQAITAGTLYANLQASVGSQGAPLILLASNPSVSPVGGQLTVQGNSVSSVARGNTTTVATAGRTTLSGVTVFGAPTVGPSAGGGTTTAQADMANLAGGLGSAGAQGGIAIAGVQQFSGVQSDGGLIASQAVGLITGVQVNPAAGGIVASTYAQFVATTPLALSASPVVVADNTASAQFQGNQAQYAYSPTAGAVLQSSVAIGASQQFIGASSSGLPGGYIALTSAQFDANSGGSGQFGAIVDASTPVSGVNLTVAGNASGAQATANTLAVELGSQSAPASLYGASGAAPQLGVASGTGPIGGIQYNTTSGVAVVETAQTVLSASVVADNQSSSFAANANLNGRVSGVDGITPSQVDLINSTLTVAGNSATAVAQGNALQISADVVGAGNSLGIATMASQNVANSNIFAEVTGANFAASGSLAVSSGAGISTDGMNQIGTVFGAGSSLTVNANSVGAAAVGNSASETVIATAPTGAANLSATIVQTSGGDSSAAGSLAGGSLNALAPVTVGAFVFDPTFVATGLAGAGNPQFSVTNNSVNATAVTNQATLVAASGTGTATLNSAPAAFNAAVSQISVGGLTESVVSAQFIAAAVEGATTATGNLGTGSASVRGNNVTASATVNQSQVSVNSLGVPGGMLSGSVSQQSYGDTVASIVKNNDLPVDSALFKAVAGDLATVSGNSVTAQALGNQATLATNYGSPVNTATVVPSAYNSLFQTAISLNASAILNAPNGAVASSQTGATIIDSNQAVAVVEGNAALLAVTIGALQKGATVTNDLTQSISSSVLSAQVQTSLKAISSVAEESGLTPGTASVTNNVIQAAVFGNSAISQASYGASAIPGGNVSGTWSQNLTNTSVSATIGAAPGLAVPGNQTAIDASGLTAAILGNQILAQAVGNSVSGADSFGMLVQSANNANISATVSQVTLDATGIVSADITGNRVSSSATANSASVASALAGPISVASTEIISQTASGTVTASTGTEDQGIIFNAEANVANVSGNTAQAAARANVASATLQSPGVIGVAQDLGLSQTNGATVTATADEVIFTAFGSSAANVNGNTITANAIGNLAGTGIGMNSLTDGAVLDVSAAQQQLAGASVNALIGLASSSIGMQAVDLASSVVLGNSINAIAAANVYTSNASLGNLNNAAAYFGTPDLPLSQLANGSASAIVDWTTTGMSLFGSSSGGASLVANNSITAAAYLNSMVNTVQSAGLVASTSIGVSTSQSISSAASASAQIGEPVLPSMASALGNSALVAGNTATSTALGNMVQNSLTVGAMNQAAGVYVTASQVNDGTQTAGTFGSLQANGNQAVMSGNALNSAAQANLASNSIALNGPLNGGSANIALNQSMSGGVFATTAGMMTAQGATGTMVAGNSLTASAIGNQATNSIAGASGYGVGSIGINTSQIATGSIIATVSGSMQGVPTMGAATVVGSSFTATAAGNVSVSVITH